MVDYCTVIFRQELGHNELGKSSSVANEHNRGRRWRRHGGSRGVILGSGSSGDVSLRSWLMGHH